MENNWTIELTEKQLNMISSCIEFTSRFACGQIGHSFLPHEIQDLMYNNKTGDKYDWDEINKRRDLFDQLGQIMKSTIHPELSSNDRISYGINKVDYADDLYDIYKMINHKIHHHKNINAAPHDVTYNVNTVFTKFGNLPNIKVRKNET